MELDARGAPKLRKFGNLSIGENLILDSGDGGRESGVIVAEVKFCVSSTPFVSEVSHMATRKEERKKNWSGKTLSPGALLAVLDFSSCHIFPPV